MLTAKQKAPSFSLRDANDQIHALSDHRGQWVLLYFYPKDDTPGCTKEACAFKETQMQFLQKNCIVYGISKDNPSSHQKFIQKYELNFTLLCDEDLMVHDAYGVLENGKTIRATFLISPIGIIEHVWPKVQVEGHAEEILNVLTLLD